MTGTAVTTTKDFQERMFERIRDQMGDLLTDEDLKKIIEAAVLKGFFEPMKTADRYGNVREDEAQFVTMVRAQVQEQVAVAVNAWVKEHSVEFDAIIKDCIGKGLTGVVAAYFDAKVNTSLYAFGENLKNAMGMR